MVKEYADNVDSFERLLVTRQAATANLHCEYESVSYNDGLIVIDNIAVIKNDVSLVSRPKLYIRVK